MADDAAGEGAARAWADAALAAALLAIDPPGCGGALVRAPAGPVRDAWLALLKHLLGPEAPPIRLPLGIRDDRLLGGLDLTATLRAGRPVAEPGLLARAHGRVLLAAMAERLSPGTAARLNAVLDRGELQVEREGLAATWPARLAVVALDEGAHDDEAAPAALAERLAFRLDLGALPPRLAIDHFGLNPAEIDAARRRLPAVQVDGGVVEALCGVAGQLGVDSLRAPLLALAVARRHAALQGREQVEEDDVVVAARLVLVPRATRLPAPAEPPPEEAEPPPEPPPNEPAPPEAAPPEPPAGPAEDRPLEEMVLEAAVAALPADLLARLKAAEAGRNRSQGDGGRAGDWQRGSARGRPAGVQRGEPRAGQRLDLIETLRAAAPWQRLRQSLGSTAAGPLIRVRPEDFQVRRYRQRRSTTTIFVVDASGSAALHRLAEAKGAVELLLADCYVRRDRVAVLAFRGRAAELLLPPTRSLVRAKRSLAGLPGGGGTPLAAAVDAAAELARAVQRQGDTPLLVLLTDGRANVARDGTGGRARAEQDALVSARALAAQGVATLLVDTSPMAQPGAGAVALAGALRATYLALPRADAAALSGVIAAHNAAHHTAKTRAER